ncbi:uncharacterized protein PHALS_15241 [Plasmopara halstedii]|uniref:Uncharacterized protein n=1 Tax=Plasmopara halstedii TaxID=4781 RepID=A0A0P1B7E8_PLAHL|nr:uncharacterized protein PHALS_15241 [Plasmopara halstedii]CEG49858.1 hypothetical protein PHALS_15241 [Plasmopara halstedii]|eukprot:XP_024586227.1 hypothetical protein PHALS_15241 [Plasmopara halstedii]
MSSSEFGNFILKMGRFGNGILHHFVPAVSTPAQATCQSQQQQEALTVSLSLSLPPPCTPSRFSCAPTFLQAQLPVPDSVS